MSKKENKNYHKFLYIFIIRPIFHPSKFLFDVSPIKFDSEIP